MVGGWVGVGWGFGIVNCPSLVLLGPLGPSLGLFGPLRPVVLVLIAIYSPLKLLKRAECSNNKDASDHLAAQFFAWDVPVPHWEPIPTLYFVLFYFN